jgi:hypothetical protein
MNMPVRIIHSYTGPGSLLPWSAQDIAECLADCGLSIDEAVTLIEGLVRHNVEIALKEKEAI